MAGWFLSSYMHVIRSPNINQKLQQGVGKRGRRTGESYTGDNCFPSVPAATIMGLQV